VTILENKDTKIKRSDKVLNSMANVATSHPEAFVTLINDIVFFDLEDRKSLQYIVLELFQANRDLIAQIFNGPRGKESIVTLLARYRDKEAVNFIGVYLRMFTDSTHLVQAWLNLDAIRALLDMVIESDFNV
jgi:hypothetical protein